VGLRRELCSASELDVRPPIFTTRILAKFAICIAACAANCLLAGPLARAQDASATQISHTFDLRGYQTELDQLSARIKLAKTSPGAIASIRTLLPSEWVVRAGDAEYHVPTDWVNDRLSDMQETPGNADAIARELQTHLGALRAEAGDLEKQASSGQGSTARAKLNSIFQAREFRNLQSPNEWLSVEERLGRWIMRQIERLARWLHISERTGNFLAWTVIALALLVLGYWVFRTISRMPRPAAEEKLPLPGPEESRNWLADAMAAAERREFREAVRCAYWAIITRLEDRKLLTRDRARTPRESLRLLASHPAEQSSLRDFTTHFELIWYGYRPASPEDWTGARAQLEKFGCLAASTAPTANS
jgi:hypothetical protein